MTADSNRQMLKNANSIVKGLGKVTVRVVFRLGAGVRVRVNVSS